MSKIILFNKPFRVLCQFTDRGDRQTLADFIDQHNVYPAGRLDYDSEGLMILTDDGQLQHRISHPNHKQPKTYWVQVEGRVSNETVEPLRTGITLNDGPCKPATVKCIAEPKVWPRTPPVRARADIPTSWLEITISEGRNRQVRRMTAAIGHPTLRLIRVAIGPWKLDHLAPGEYQQHPVHAPTKRPPHKNRRPAPNKHTANRRVSKRKRPV